MPSNMMFVCCVYMVRKSPTAVLVHLNRSAIHQSTERVVLTNCAAQVMSSSQCDSSNAVADNLRFEHHCVQLVSLFHDQ